MNILDQLDDHAENLDYEVMQPANVEKFSTLIADALSSQEEYIENGADTFSAPSTSLVTLDYPEQNRSEIQIDDLVDAMGAMSKNMSKNLGMVVSTIDDGQDIDSKYNVSTLSTLKSINGILKDQWDQAELDRKLGVERSISDKGDGNGYGTGQGDGESGGDSGDSGDTTIIPLSGGGKDKDKKKNKRKPKPTKGARLKGFAGLVASAVALAGVSEATGMTNVTNMFGNDVDDNSDNSSSWFGSDETTVMQPTATPEYKSTEMETMQVAQPKFVNQVAPESSAPWMFLPNGEPRSINSNPVVQKKIEATLKRNYLAKNPNASVEPVGAPLNYSERKAKREEDLVETARVFNSATGKFEGDESSIGTKEVLGGTAAMAIATGAAMKNRIPNIPMPKFSMPQTPKFSIPNFNMFGNTAMPDMTGNTKNFLGNLKPNAVPNGLPQLPSPTATSVSAKPTALQNIAQGGRKTFGGAGKLLSKAAMPVNMAMNAYNAYDIYNDETLSRKEKTVELSGVGGSIGGAAAGGMAGAALGGALGTVVPVLGNAVGGIVGGLGGSILGAIYGEKYVKELSESMYDYFAEDKDGTISDATTKAATTGGGDVVKDATSEGGTASPMNVNNSSGTNNPDRKVPNVSSSSTQSPYMKALTPAVAWYLKSRSMDTSLLPKVLRGYETNASQSLADNMARSFAGEEFSAELAMTEYAKAKGQQESIITRVDLEAKQSIAASTNAGQGMMPVDTEAMSAPMTTEDISNMSTTQRNNYEYSQVLSGVSQPNIEREREASVRQNYVDSIPHPEINVALDQPIQQKPEKKESTNKTPKKQPPTVIRQTVPLPPNLGNIADLNGVGGTNHLNKGIS